MYYLTVGYPLGMEVFEGRQVYQIYFRSKIFNLIPLEYRIWSKFLLGAYETDVKKTLSDVDLNGYIPTMNKLVQSRMLVAVEEENEAGFRTMKFLRQGIGIGLDFEKNTYYILFREKVELTSLEYNIWKEADGVNTYNILEKNVRLKYQIPSFEIKRTTIELCRRGMIFAVNCEER